MLTKITLVVALCSGIHASDVQKRMADLMRSNPGSTVSIRIDKKAQCYNGQILTGQQAKFIEALGK